MIGLMNPANKIPIEDAIATLKAALEAGANFWNAGEHYGTPDYNSLHLLKAYFSQYPEDVDKVVISVKGCFDMRTAKPSNDTEGVETSIDHCLEIIDSKYRIDLFQPSRVDPDLSIEETVRAIAEYVKAGKVGSIGLSECSATTIRKAVAVHPIAAVEIELSLFETSVLTKGVAKACKENGIPLVAYSPLGRGFLTGKWQKFEDLPANDFRKMFPRFQADVFEDNIKLTHAVERLAKRKGCTAAQVAIAWAAAQGENVGVPVMPIPGASSIARVAENMARIHLTAQELSELDEYVKKIEVKGARVPAKFAHLLEV